MTLISNYRSIFLPAERAEMFINQYIVPQFVRKCLSTNISLRSLCVSVYRSIFCRADYAQAFIAQYFVPRGMRKCLSTNIWLKIYEIQLKNIKKGDLL
jgi:hypothetical protein